MSIVRVAQYGTQRTRRNTEGTESSLGEFQKLSYPTIRRNAEGAEGTQRTQRKLARPSEGNSDKALRVLCVGSAPSAILLVRYLSEIPFAISSSVVSVLLRVLCVPLLLALTACDAPAPKLNTGDPAPAFTTTALDGVTIRFPDDLKNQPVVLRFWADWCRFCEGEMQAIERVYQRRKGLRVLAVNAGQSRDEVAAFVKKISITYPALLDEGSAITRQYGVTGLPTTYFVGADGRIRGKVIGEADEATFDRLAGELQGGGAR
jgi:cytochrome c biogenesis protein CcmG, thiol:disulfide interchange protein DsbE